LSGCGREVGVATGRTSWTNIGAPEDNASMKFEIVSYVGALPLKLGMTEAEVARVIGLPGVKMKNRKDESDHDHGFCAVGYDKDTHRANFFGFRPPTEIAYEGMMIFDDPAALNTLMARDGQPFEFVGFILLLNLGISLSGFHDNDEAQRAINIFERGRFEKYRSQMKPYALRS
jgi:hypothetical protein